MLSLQLGGNYLYEESDSSDSLHAADHEEHHAQDTILGLLYVQLGDYMAKKSKKETDQPKDAVDQEAPDDLVMEEVEVEGVDEEVEDDACETEEDEISLLKETVVRLQKEVEDYKSQYLRKHADFENFRKRMLREKEESIKYANTSLLKDLIAVIDDFERAIDSAQGTSDFEGFLSGIKLIEKQFASMLEHNWGLKRMEAVGKEFDPQKHEALMMEEDPQCDTDTVVEDYQKGYVLHDRVIRHAKVKVGRPPVEVASDAGDSSI